mmetsp:Transcript_45348/g.55020  ORF Transcript_45348/g.55020 Transcript_45348/m.55020 type:complete len:351 (-) Transcript_45348:56-1108(-)|eukprot:CAMPEP_0172496118 /NCGR_PEP_ID=MMETSP1066-20121228/81769_1 /TAXON_ID=671091 /ORGANISM="Coscinodiscus wailesii, Strain CCMP2513" /LENGTH=350 /DNA_ID=CAMNT_0013268239 /DNA_START=54 /DNA_END=1106 /DNA_ORIENTATION=-
MYGEEESQQLKYNGDGDEEDSYIEESRSPRFVHWFAFLLFSLITMGSSIEAADHDDGALSRANHRWAIACAATSLVITIFIVLLHMSPITSIFVVNTRLEGTAILILIGFWAASATVVSNAQDGLAVNDAGAVVYGNLYYFTWGGFVCSLTLFVSYLRSVYHIDVREELKARSARLNYWTSLMVFCMVMMGSSASIYDQYCGEGNGSSFCARTTLAVIIGVMGSILSLIIIGVKIGTAVAPFWLEAGFSVLLFFSFSFGVAFITSEKGPGAPLGNLYYSTWAAFASTFLIGSSVFEDYDTAKKKRREEEAMEGECDMAHLDYVEEYSHEELDSLDDMDLSRNENEGFGPN